MRRRHNVEHQGPKTAAPCPHRDRPRWHCVSLFRSVSISDSADSVRKANRCGGPVSARYPWLRKLMKQALLDMRRPPNGGLASNMACSSSTKHQNKPLRSHIPTVNALLDTRPRHRALYCDPGPCRELVRSLTGVLTS